MAIKARRVRLRVSWGVEGMYRTFRGYEINAAFAVFRTDELDRWRVMHRGTGRLLGRVFTFPAARKLVSQALGTMPLRKWKTADIDEMKTAPEWKTALLNCR